MLDFIFQQAVQNWSRNAAIGIASFSKRRADAHMVWYVVQKIIAMQMIDEGLDLKARVGPTFTSYGNMFLCAH